MPVPFDEASVLSRSRLGEVPDGVVEAVREGDRTEDSLIGEGMDEGKVKIAFSLPVTASDMARNPIRGFRAEWALCVEGVGDPLEAVLTCGGEVLVTRFVRGFSSYSSLVTVGEEISLFRELGAICPTSFALEFRILAFALFP